MCVSVYCKTIEMIIIKSVGGTCHSDNSWITPCDAPLFPAPQWMLPRNLLATIKCLQKCALQSYTENDRRQGLYSTTSSCHSTDCEVKEILILQNNTEYRYVLSPRHRRCECRCLSFKSQNHKIRGQVVSCCIGHKLNKASLGQLAHQQVIQLLKFTGKCPLRQSGSGCQAVDGVRRGLLPLCTSWITSVTAGPLRGNGSTRTPSLLPLLTTTQNLKSE